MSTGVIDKMSLPIQIPAQRGFGRGDDRKVSASTKAIDQEWEDHLDQQYIGCSKDEFDELKASEAASVATATETASVATATSQVQTTDAKNAQIEADERVMDQDSDKPDRLAKNDEVIFYGIQDNHGWDEYKIVNQATDSYNQDVVIRGLLEQLEQEHPVGIEGTRWWFDEREEKRSDGAYKTYEQLVSYFVEYILRLKKPAPAVMYTPQVGDRVLVTHGAHQGRHGDVVCVVRDSCNVRVYMELGQLCRLPNSYLAPV